MNTLKTNEIGRSMIEMLGVLAIIGVLSVGGIAGYSKAMNKFKTNKIADNISMLVANIKTLYAQQNTYAGLNNGTAVAMGVVPDELGTAYSGTGDSATATLTNAFNGSVLIKASGSTAEGDNKAFSIVFNSISREACITLATNDWGSGYSSGLIALQASGGAQSLGDKGDFASFADSKIGCSGKDASGNANAAVAIACPGGSTQKVPLSVVEAAKACNCTAGNSCSIALKYY